MDDTLGSGDPPRKMGRPALFEKPVKCTFMLTERANAIIERKRQEMKLSRSDVVVMAIEYYDRRRNAPISR